MNIKKPSSKKRTFPVLALFLFLSAACSREVAPLPKATETPALPIFEITYCDINPSDLCLEGFGLNNDEGLLILLKTNDPLYANIYIRADGPEGEMPFECQKSEQFPENVYCLGDPVDEKQLLKLNIYSKKSDKLIAIGVFNVQFAKDLPEPDVKFGATAIPSPASPATPSYPNPPGPTPSYPNPTSAP